MTDEGGTATLIFYKVGERWWKEPLLNIVAAAAQMSSFTHVELAIGDSHASDGSMRNVCRIFNDSTGCELTARTGRNPQYTYLQLGCSKAQENAMLRFARSCVGTPFSTSGMARSVFWPRTTDRSSYFCAELVADVLREGGLLDRSSNPGAATPEGLHNLYKSRAAATANPYLLRQANCQRKLTTDSVVTPKIYTPPQLAVQRHNNHPTHASATATAMAGSFSKQPLYPITTTYIHHGGGSNGCARAAPSNATHATFPAVTASRDAPLCGTAGAKSALRILNAGNSITMSSSRPPLGLTLNSLDFRR